MNTIYIIVMELFLTLLKWDVDKWLLHMYEELFNININVPKWCTATFFVYNDLLPKIVAVLSWQG